MQIYFFINKLQKAYCYCICTNEVGEIKTEAFASAYFKFWRIRQK